MEKARDRIGVPLVLLSHSAVHLEKPSVKTRRAAGRELGKKLQPADYQHESLLALRKSVLGEEEDGAKKMKKRKKSGPNPLSCKPSKKALKQRPTQSPSNTTDEVTDSKPKRRRKKRYRCKIAPHIMAHLKMLAERGEVFPR